MGKEFFRVAGLSFWLPRFLFTSKKPMQAREVTAWSQDGHDGIRPQHASSSLLWAVYSDEWDRAAGPGQAAALEAESFGRAKKGA